MARAVTGRTVPPEPGAASLLIDIEELSALLNRSVASLERDQAAGRVPAPVYVGSSKRWRRAEVEAWVAAGCPVQTGQGASTAARTGGTHVA
jgi:predicted DNA-binding transcriptional regulator AlpA